MRISKSVKAMNTTLKTTLVIVCVFCIGNLFAQNIGIGTQNPQAKLHVVQDSSASVLQLNDETNDPTPFVVDSNGSVGIGITNPTEKLEVNGRIKDKTGYVMPVGTVLPYFGTTAPQGWLLCDGAAISRSTYNELFTVIGTSCGYGNNSTTFNLPDLRGMFLRGVDGTAGNDPDKTSRTALNTGGNTGNNIGSYQGDAAKISAAGASQNQAGSDLVRKSSGTSFADVHGNETRPINVYVNFIIKY